MSPTEMAYRKTAVEGAGGFGLLIGLYDTLAGNLRRAAEAERRNDIETRCRELNHAFLVLGFLQDRIERGSGGELAQQLATFYSSVRRKIIEAQVKRSAELLERQMAEVLKIRKTWQDVELRASSAMEAPLRSQSQSYPGTSPAQYERSASSWSA
jgi:flagellar biosynthetic protein FliS